MKTGDPNDPDDPALAPWPIYDPAGERMLVLDTPITETAAYHAEQCAVLDQAPVFPTCNTALCRQFMTKVLGVRGWWPMWGWFLDETGKPPPKPPKTARK